MTADEPNPAVYFAGPVDYVEHRSPGDHRRDIWRHRFFDDLPILILCPTCLNMRSDGFRKVMAVNDVAIQDAEFFVGYFPGDVATFGTPVETWAWCMADVTKGPGTACLIHPSSLGIFVQALQADCGLVVVRSFEEARAWLRRALIGS